MEDFSNRIVDRIPQFDVRSRGFAAIAPDDKREFISKLWHCDVYNDQGQEGACVGFMWTHELAAKPKSIKRDASFALNIYNRARQLDPWPGEEYSGTSVLAGIQAVQEILNSKGKPLIKEYRWAFGIEDVLRTLAYQGPVGLGIEWHNSHYYPDANGQIWLDNNVVGGHAILAKGVDIVKIDPNAPATTLENVDVHKSLVRLHNSWGTNYGIGGDCFMSVYDLRYLLSQGGEACIPYARSKE